MGDLVVKRTLVKSPPELWTEVSEVERLARHIGELGHIRISRLEPESAVAWEGDLASGTVEIEASGWGTRVILTAEVDEEAASGSDEPEGNEPEAEARTDQEPGAPVEPEAEPEAQPEAEAPTEHEPEPPAEPEPSAEPELAPEATTTAPDPPAGAPWAPPEEPNPEPVVKQAAPTRRGFLARWLFRDRRAAPEAPPAPTPPRPDPVVAEEPRPAPATPAGALAAPELERAAGPEPEPAPEPKPAPEPEPSAPDEADPTIDSGLPPPAGTSREDSPPDPPAPPDAEPEEAEADTSTPESERVRAVFEAALDSLGSAHHRPFSRG